MLDGIVDVGVQVGNVHMNWIVAEMLPHRKYVMEEESVLRDLPVLTRRTAAGTAQ